MSNEWFQMVLAGVAILVVVVLVSSSTRIPGSGQTASVIDAVMDTVIDTVPIEPVSAPIEPALVDSASTTPIDISNFTEILQDVADSFEDFAEPVPVSLEEKKSLTEPAVTKGISGLKIFILTEDILESGLNNWFAAEQGIVVDDIKVDDYGGGGYLVVVSYHMGGTDHSSTRFKLISGENPEADAQTFLSSLSSSQTVRSISATTRSYPKFETTVFAPLIFIVYE